MARRRRVSSVKRSTAGAAGDKPAAKASTRRSARSRSSAADEAKRPERAASTSKRKTPAKTKSASQSTKRPARKAPAEGKPERKGKQIARAAASTGETFQRTCPECGKRLRLPETSRGEIVQCPQCTAEVEATPDEFGRERDELIATGSGWAVSVGVHVVLFVIAASITWLVGIPEEEAEADRIIVEQPVREAIDTLQTQLDKLDGPPSEIREVNSNPSRSTPVRTITTQLNTPAETLVGIEIASGVDAPPGDWMSLGTGTGRGGGSGGAGFFGLEARGRNFIYVVDLSSSMYGHRIRAAKMELIRSIESMEGEIHFHVIFYTTRAIPMPNERLVEATLANKRSALAWIEDTEVRQARTNPTDALQKALGLKPDAIWLLSDGEFGEHNETVLKAIRKENPDKKTQIHTIGFHSNEGEAILRRIASENRGRYRFVPPQ